MHIRSLIGVSVIFLGLIGGCSNEPPISTTLTDLIAESNDYNADPAVQFHENVSINGLLFQPQAGAHWYTAKPGFVSRMLGARRSSPEFAFGISSKLGEPTFALSGTTPTVDITHVNSVKKTIEAIQAATVEAATTTVDLALARQAKEQAAKSSTSATQPAASVENAQKKIDELTAKKKEVDEKLVKALNDYRDVVASNPGLIVARWTVRNSSGAGAKSGIFDTNYSETKQTSGYVVLGGVRVTAMYFGDDLRMYVRIIGDDEAALFDKLGITTSLIQTKALAYTNALDLQRAFAASLNLKISSLSHLKDLLTEMDKIAISAYFATAMNLDNTGSLNNAVWSALPRPMVEYVKATDEDLKELNKIQQATPEQTWVRVRPTTTFQKEKRPAGALPTTRENLLEGDWYTVVAVTVEAPRVFEAFRKSGGPRHENIGERTFVLMAKASLEERTEWLKVGQASE